MIIQIVAIAVPMIVIVWLLNKQTVAMQKLLNELINMNQKKVQHYVNIEENLGFPSSVPNVYKLDIEPTVEIEIDSEDSK